MNNENPPEKKLESPILRKQSTPFTDEVQRLHAELASVFGDIGEPVLFVDDGLCDASTDRETPTPPPRAQPEKGVTGFGGEADLTLINGHIPTDKPKKINPDNFLIEPDSPCWRIKVQDFGLGIIEVVASKQYEKMRRPKHNERKSLTREDMIPEQLEKSVQRSKTQLRHKALMLKVDRMLTLTYAENMKDRDKAYIDFDKFLKLYKRLTGENLEYVAVTEKQKRGAIHFHLALNKFINVNTIRKCWPHGIIQIERKAEYIQGGKNKRNIGRIAGYMSKYLSKDIAEQDLNSKRYSSSRGIAKPEVKTYYIPFGDNTFRLIGDIVMLENRALIGKIIDFGSVIWCSTYT